MKINKLKTLLATFLIFGASVAANAQLLTFDDLPSTISTPINPGYGSVVWINFYYLDNTIVPIVAPSGYHNGAVSGTQVAYNGSGTPASVTSGSLLLLPVSG